MHCSLIYNYAAAGQLDDALELANTLIEQSENPKSRMEISQNIARAIAKAAPIEKTKTFNDKMTEIALDLLEESQESCPVDEFSEFVKRDAFDSIRDVERFQSLLN